MVLAVTFLLVVLGALNLRDRVQPHLYPDDGVVWVNGRRGVTASTVHPGSPAYKVGIVHGHVLRAVMSSSIAGDGVFWEDTPQGVRAKEVIPNSPAAKAGIEQGQILIGISRNLPGNRGDKGFDKINNSKEVGFYLDRAGIDQPLTYMMQEADNSSRFTVDLKTAATYRPVSDPSDVTRFLDNQVGMYGNVTYAVESFNQFGISKGILDADLVNVGPPPTHNWRDAYLSLVGMVFLFIGLYVLLRQSRTPYTFHFYTICLVAFIVFFYKSTGDYVGVDKAIYIAKNLGLIFLAPLLLHFCAIFPTRRGPLYDRPWIRPLIYVPGVILAIGEIAFTVAYSTNFPWLRHVLSQMSADFRGRLDWLIVFQFVAFLLIGTGLLIRTYLQAVWSREAELRRQMKIIIWGMGVGSLPYAIITSLTYLRQVDMSENLEALAVGPLILIPVSLAYAVRRYRLMDVDVLVRRSMVYALSTLSVAAMLMLAVVSAGEAIRNYAPGVTTIFQVAIMTLMAMLYTPIKNWLQVRIDKIFYGETYDLRTGLTDFGRALSSTTALESLLSTLSHRLSVMLSVNDVAIFIEDPASSSGFRAAYSESSLQLIRLPEDFKQTLRAATATRGYMMAEDFSKAVEPAESRKLHYFVPCVVRDRLIAVIAVGRTKDGDLLSSEDTDILRGLSGYVAAAIENSLLYRSEKERAEELTRLKDFNENIIESISVGILTVKPDGTITNLNSTFERLLGIERNKAVGRNLTEVFDEDTLATIRDVVGERGWELEESRSVYKFALKGPDGNDLIVNFTVAPLESKNGTVTGGVITIEDVTARVRLEEQLQQSDKLSSIGLLAAGVAHEVNTPLTGISSYTQMLMSQISDTNPQHRILEKIHAQTLRASGIVNNLLNFSRTAGTDFGDVNLNQVLDDTIQLLEHQLRHSNVTITRHYETDLPYTIGSASRLQQVFMNLIINARDAMPSGGKLDISTFTMDGATYVEFTDEGVGIAPENITRIYDPFFTTKEIGKGTGLGLAISYGIIQEHGGRIFVTSKPGDGTTFRIKLPAVSARMQVASD